MSALVALLVPIIVLAVVGLILIALVEKFSPDATITYIIKLVVFAVIVILIVQKIIPMVHL